jgi:ribonuclease P/MRP protein subunit POP5
MKVKLLPSLKEKKRYIAFNLSSEGKIAKKDIINSVNVSCKNFMGELSYGEAGVRVIDNLVDGNKGVVRVNSKYVDITKASLMLIKKINNQKVLFKNVKVSGVLNKVK